MARRTNKHLRPPRPLSAGYARDEERSDGRWIVRDVPGAQAVKAYTCPGCQGTVAPGTPHVVAWPALPAVHATSAVEDRRHWHTGCWQRRR